MWPWELPSKRLLCPAPAYAKYGDGPSAHCGGQPAGERGEGPVHTVLGATPRIGWGRVLTGQLPTPGRKEEDDSCPTPPAGPCTFMSSWENLGKNHQTPQGVEDIFICFSLLCSPLSKEIAFWFLIMGEILAHYENLHAKKYFKKVIKPLWHRDVILSFF